MPESPQNQPAEPAADRPRLREHSPAGILATGQIIAELRRATNAVRQSELIGRGVSGAHRRRYIKRLAYRDGLAFAASALTGLTVDEILERQTARPTHT